VYLLLQKREGDGDFSTEELDVGFGTLPDGSRTCGQGTSNQLPRRHTIPLQIKGEEDSRLWVTAPTIEHTWQYGGTVALHIRRGNRKRIHSRVFLPWMLALNRSLVLPQSKRRIPFEEYEAV
jgi:hypothetical protein